MFEKPKCKIRDLPEAEKKLMRSIIELTMEKTGLQMYFTIAGHDADKDQMMQDLENLIDRGVMIVEYDDKTEEFYVNVHPEIKKVLSESKPDSSILEALSIANGNYEEDEIPPPAGSCDFLDAGPFHDYEDDDYEGDDYHDE